MRWDFGQVYKSIRMGKGLSQKDVCHNQINRTTLSRVENDNQNTSFETMQYLLDQINVSWDEFQYICNEFQPNFRDKIINEYYTVVSTAEIEKISKFLKCGTKIEREKLRNVALAYISLDAAMPSEDTMKLVEKYVDGNIEIVEILKIVIEKYHSSELER